MTLRVNHGQGGGQRAVRFVVIGDDQVDAQLTRAERRLGAADPAVHRHNERDAVLMEPVDCGRLQPVAVAQPLGDEVHDRSAEHFERPSEDHRRRDAVDVVVTVDRDALAARERQLEPRDRTFHVPQAERIVQMIQRRIEEALRRGGVVQPAEAEQTRDGRMQAERCRQRGRLFFIAWQMLPDERSHGRSGFRGPSGSAASESMKAVPSAPIFLNFSYRAASSASTLSVDNSASACASAWSTSAVAAS